MFYSADRRRKQLIARGDLPVLKFTIQGLPTDKRIQAVQGAGWEWGPGQMSGWEWRCPPAPEQQSGQSGRSLGHCKWAARSFRAEKMGEIVHGRLDEWRRSSKTFLN